LRLRTFGGLWIENGDRAGDGAPRPRALALLAILAAAGAKGVSRDRLLGILWPESEPERARHILSQNLYNLRRDLGVEVVLSTPDLRLDSRQISNDVGEFRAAVRGKNWNDVASLYAGPFLDGFYLADAPEFERWVESERASFVADAGRAIAALAAESAAQGRRAEAAEYWGRLARLDPVNSRVAVQYMEALAALGDRTSALAHGKAHTDFLRREFDAEPDAQVSDLMTRLRPAAPSAIDAARPRQEPPPTPDEAAQVPVGVPPDGGHSIVASAPPAERAAVPRTVRRKRARALRLVGSAVVVVGVVTTAWRAGVGSRAGNRPVLAVGRIRDLVTADSMALGGVLSEMLATSLTRLSDLQVVANSRMLELTPRNADTSRGVVTDAARRAGATEMLEGEVRPLPNRQLALEVRRVSIAQGLVRRGYRVTGVDRIALFDSVTALIAADLHVPPPAGSLGEISTRSPVAYRLYEEGLRELYQFDYYTASSLFQSAIAEDSTFAMATYYAALAAAYINDSTQTTLAQRALALASKASEHDRLLIVTNIGARLFDPRAHTTAETLAARYQHDPDALVVSAGATQDLTRAIELFNRSIALDSAAGVRPGAICRLCAALDGLQERYFWADSMEAVLRTLDRWSALRPADNTPWVDRAVFFIVFGRRAEAEAALHHAQTMGGAIRDITRTRNLMWSLALHDFAGANAQCDTALATRDITPTQLEEYGWDCTINLRMQGRYREARALVYEGRFPGSNIVRRTPADPYLVALLDLETDRPLAAADTFRAIGRRFDASVTMPDGLRARNVTWMLTLAATAAVAGGDLEHARRLVDTIEAVGRRSGFARDPVLHHFVRGLLLSRAGRHDAAVPEFRAAMVSPTNGYTRINYELGKSLLSLGRPQEAIPVLRGPLRGGFEGSGLYLSQTETHELLARAFDAAGQRDSAAAHYTLVERAWRGADPFLRPRYEAVKAWLALHRNASE
jgi:DNA-binding SARP family transcriptional activator/tetratricopeptide (TPR) repeat protein